MHKILGALLIAVFTTPALGFTQTHATIDEGDGTTRTPAIQLPARIMPDRMNRESGLADLPPALPPQQPRERSWPGRHPVLFGTLVGLGAGLAVEAAVIPGASGGEPHSAYIPMFAGVGAGIGWLVGLIVSAGRRP
jgi:hypothetical protein